MKNKKGFVKKLASVPIFLLLLMSLWAMAKESKYLAQKKTSSSPYTKEQIAEIEKYLEKANDYFDTAEFTFAQIFFDKALRIDKENPEITAKIEECKRYKELQKQLSQSAPKADKLQDYLDSKYKTAVALYKQKKYPEARKEFEEIWLLSLKGKFKKTQNYLSDIKKDMAEEAQKTAKTEPAAPAPKNKDAQVKKIISDGKNLLKQERFDEAMGKFREALGLDPKNKDAQNLLKKAENEKTNSLAKAEEKKKEELAKQQKAEAKARTEAEKNKQKEIENKIEKIITDAEKLRDQKKFDEATAKTQQALLMDPQNKDAQKLLKDIEKDKTAALAKTEEMKKQELAKQQKAEEEKKKELAAQKEKELDKIISDAEKLLDQKKFDEATAKTQQALLMDPQNKDAQNLLKNIEKQKAAAVSKPEEKKKEEVGEKPKIEEAKKKQEEIKKLVSESENLLKKGNYDESIAKAQQVLQIDKNNQQALGLLKKAENEKAQLLVQAEQKRKEEVEGKRKVEESAKKAKEQEAQKEEERIKKIQEQNLQKAKELTEEGKKLLDKGKFEEAINKADEALKIEPLYAEAANLKKTATEKIDARKAEGQKQAQLEQEAKARKEKIQSLIKEGNDLFDKGDYDGATRKFQECLSLDPSHKEAQEMLNEITEVKQNEKVKKAYELVKEGNAFLGENKFDEARAKFQEALGLDSNNKGALSGLEEITRKQDTQHRRTEEDDKRKKSEESRRLFDLGLKAYEEKNIETAVAKWQEALTLDPNNANAQTYLEQTRQEYETYKKKTAEKESFEKLEGQAKGKMNTLISVSTTVPHTPLISYLDSLSLVSGINFYVTSGVEATVDAKFVDTPLYEVLDTLLLPIGLKWSRKPGTDIVTITPDLQPKLFNLTPEESAKVKSVMDNGDLQKILWGKDGVPQMKGVELTLDEREGLLISVDSRHNIKKLEAFLQDLKTQAPPGLIFRTYRLREGEGPKVKSLIEAMLEADSKAPFSPERKLLLDGRDLIIKDSPENIKKVEALLEDKDFIEKIRSDKLQVQTWILVTKEALKQNPEQMRQFGEWVVEVIKVMIYAKSTVSKAEAEGRRLWWDPATMQLTITDYPDNIQAVADFIHSLPQLEQKAKTKIVPLRYAKSSEIATRVNSFLGLGEAGAEGGTVTTGMSVTRSLSVGQDFTFRDITVRLMRVNENDVNDKNDDSAELKIRTLGESRDTTLEEFDSEQVGDYEIIAEDITPSGTPGEGRAKLKVTFTPPLGTQQQLLMITPVPTPAVTEEGEKPVQEISEINAIFVEYKDPTHLAKVQEWIERLDVRKQQVSIETKFVEVLESRAKEFSSQLGIADLTEGINFDDSVLNMRYANDLDEVQNAIRSQYEPPAESPYFQHLLKGTTVFSLITGGNSPINWQLRLLEAEGVVNVVNGPHIVVQNGETASFRISRVLGGIPTVDSTGNVIGGQGIQSYSPVDISIDEVFISQLGEIELALNAIIEDLDALTGGSVVQQQQIPGQQQPTTGNVQYTLSRLTKDFQTRARIKDGGTLVIGGWTSERSGDYKSGIPVIRHIPFIGKLLFGRNLRHIDKITLLIFLTARIVE